MDRPGRPVGPPAPHGRRRRGRGPAHRYAANVARLLGDLPAAEKAYDSSIRIWEELADRFPDEAGYRDNLAQTLRDFAMFQKRAGKLRDAAATAGRAAELAEGLKG